MKPPVAMTTRASAHRTCLRTVAWLCAAVLNLSACDLFTQPDDAEGFELAPAAAAPLEYVRVENLPRQMLGADHEIEVGGRVVSLQYSTATESHGFIVPADLTPGAVDVEIDGAGTNTLTVQPVTFPGGTPETAITEFNDVLDDFQVSIVSNLNTLSASRSAELIAEVQDVGAVIEELQTAIAALSPAERQTAAVLFAARTDTYNRLAADLASLTALTGSREIRNRQAGVTADSSGAAAAMTQVADIVARCEAHMQRLDDSDLYADAADDAAAALELLAVGGVPIAKVAATLMAVEASLLKLTNLYLNYLPLLFDPNGLLLEPNHIRIPDTGGRSEMSAWVTTRSAGQFTGAAFEAIAGKLVKSKAANDRLSARVAAKLRELGLEHILSRIGDLLDDAIGDTGLGGAGQMELADFAQVRIINRTLASSWDLGTDGSILVRPVPGLESDQEQDVRVSGIIGRLLGTDGQPGCMAETAAAETKPSEGLNGFVVTAGVALEFGTAALSVEARQGATAELRIPVTNIGRMSAGQLDFEVPYPPADVRIIVSSKPAALAPGASGTVVLQVSPASDAAVLISFFALQATNTGSGITKRVGVVPLAVEVKPQLAGIVVNRESSTIRIWDSGQQDGDEVTITLNGATLVSGHSLLNAGTVIPVRYRPGNNILTITALNEGSLTPNTAALSLANVVHGAASQGYSLRTGQITQLVISYDPSAGPVVAAAAPTPAYRWCLAGMQAQDCRAR